ncbi:sirohydrochlorin chelatase [Paenibacillus methanolicus]|uniref:Sirohydrochlorin cobaltochelatase n=1 Tax=Paenibacillus methanolicus TaxID=582686 RepID=A0A5S5BYG5_9BACL|nr:sirohydrochlorin chelatase [Paenibacillus methanolicus]TYP71336.1 sirohydrochlorin cobaltochelatase [Paenibacillus methanolicus]
MDAVLFVGHGSRDAEGNDEVRAFVSAVADRLEGLLVETCFLEFEKPTLDQGLDKCAALGAKRVAVIPITLFSAGHAKLHIPAAIDEARERHRSVRFIYGRPIGVHDQVLEILSARLRESGLDPEAELRDTAVLVVGRGSSDPDANSDLFKIARLFWERLKVGYVETAFMGVTDPLVEAGAERCLKLGAKHVIVLPYFLFTGVLIKRMEDMLEGLKARYPEHDFTLARYFGFHPTLQTILLERAREALGEEVKMNCDMCQYRLAAAAEHGHHHHHHDDGGHHHHHDHDHGHHDGHDHHHDHDHHDGHDHHHNHDHHDGHDHEHHRHDHDHRHDGHGHERDKSDRPAALASEGLQ